MPFILDRGRRVLAMAMAVSAIGAVAAGSAHASLLGLGGGRLTPSASALSTANCGAQTFTTPFSRWLDFGSYTLAPGGDFESSAAGWLTSGSASVVADNESYHVTGNPSDAHALQLNAGAEAVSPTMCVSLLYPYMRMFVRRAGSAYGALSVEVLYRSALTGLVSSLPLPNLSLTGTSWTPTLPIPMLVDLLAPLSSGGQAPVALRFTAQGTGSAFRIDDVYVDPYRRA